MRLVNPQRMVARMTDWRDKIKKTMKERGVSMRRLADAAGLGETGVRDMLNPKLVSSPRLMTSESVANQLGLTLGEIFGERQSRSIPIIGHVSAGEGWLPFEDDSEIDRLELTVDVGEAVGLIVRGDSMSPVYRDGDILIGTKRASSDLSSLIGSDCILQTVGGERFVKFVAKGTERGRLNLKSYNPVHPDRVNIAIAWAAPIQVVWRAGSTQPQLTKASKILAARTTKI